MGPGVGGQAVTRNLILIGHKQRVASMLTCRRNVQIVKDHMGLVAVSESTQTKRSALVVRVFGKAEQSVIGVDANPSTVYFGFR